MATTFRAYDTPQIYREEEADRAGSRVRSIQAVAETHSIIEAAPCKLACVKPALACKGRLPEGASRQNRTWQQKQRPRWLTVPHLSHSFMRLGAISD